MKQELSYILSADARQIEQGEIKMDKLQSYYDVALGYNQDLIYLDTLDSNVIYTKKVRNKEKQFTDILINVKFNKTLKVDNPFGKAFTVKTTSEYRKQFYTEGFDFNGSHYVFYKRSASKAKGGTCLFIREDYFEPMMNWTLMGMTFEQDEEVDLASLLAYSSLTLSSLEGTINIPVDKIVIIDEEFSTFTTKASVTDMIGNVPVVSDREIEQSNNLWDGQCLIDATLLNKSQFKGRASVQLRNKFFKTMAFSTNIYKFLHNHNIKTVKDMFGREYDAKDVKLIITKSCLKLFKFVYKFNNDKEKMYRHWLNNISSEFGVCKTEHETKHGFTEDNRPINQLSYQMINSMSLSKEEIGQLAKKEIDYINSLKTDLDVFMKHIELNDRSVTREMYAKLINHSKYFAQVDVFKDFRRQTIRNYEKKVRKGKVRIDNADYMIIVSNPLEMLYKVANKEFVSPLGGYEVYTKLFDDNTDLAIFRSPHICKANILHAVNKHCKEIDRYFNFNNNILVVNSIDSLVMQRLQGADCDGDSILATDNEIIVRNAKESMELLVPINNISFGLTKRKYNNESAYLIDKEICKNKIGVICNLAQDVNTTIACTKRKKRIKELLDAVSLLSSLSQLEIDRSKKYFSKEELDINVELAKIKALDIETGYFTNYTKSKVKKVTNHKKCGMDMLERALDKGIIDMPKSETLEVLNLVNYDLYDSKKVNEKQIAQIKEVCKILQGKINSISAENGIDNKTKANRIMIAKDYAFNDCQKIKMNESTIIALLGRIYNKYDKSNQELTSYKSLVLQFLFTNKKGNLYNVLYKSPQK